MISAAPAPAPAIEPAVSTPIATANAAPGFDAVLVLQSLTATAQSLDAASFEAVDTADLLSAEDGEEEDGEDDLEASLAFLSALLTATHPKNAAGDLGTGAQGQGSPPEEGASAVTARNPANDSPAGFALDAEPREQKSDALLNLAAVPPEPLETRTSGDAAQNLARAAEMLAQAPRPAAAAATPQTTVTAHVRDPRWADEMGARVSLMVRAGESTASLALTPVDLGPMEVNVTVKDSQASIHFGASHAETRALIEASLPRLRELLAAQGFNLTDASVSSGFSRSHQQASSQGERAGDEAEVSTTEARVARHLGLLDLYA